LALTGYGQSTRYLFARANESGDWRAIWDEFRNYLVSPPLLDLERIVA